jgi:membrane protein YqaA with SNARE-associated domain
MLLEVLQAAQHSAAAPHHSAHHGTLHWLASFGAVGMFVVAAIDTSFIPLPIPACTDLLLLLLVASHPSTWLLYVFITLAGSLVGSYTSHQVGAKGGHAILERFVPKKYLGPITKYVDSHAFWSVSLAALLPPPMPMTPVALAAGALKVPRLKFILAFGSFRFLQYLAVGWLAHKYSRQMMHWWHRYFGAAWEPIVWTMVGITALGIAYGVWKVLKMRKEGKLPQSTARKSHAAKTSTTRTKKAHAS